MQLFKKCYVRKLIISALAVAMTVAFPAGVSAANGGASESAKIVNAQTDKGVKVYGGDIKGKTILFKNNAVYNGSFKSELLDEELVFYNAMYEHCITNPSNSTLEIDLSGKGYTTSDRTKLVDFIRSAFFAFAYDHPEVYWIDSYSYSYSYSYWTSGGRISEIDITMEEAYTGAFSERSIVSRGITAAVNEITSSRASSSRYDTLMAIHDYICENAEYDNDVIQGGAYEGDHAEDQTAAPLFGGGSRGKKFVCEGYSEAFKILCDRFGIPSVHAISEDHAWNYVQMENGKWYAVDVTWDDNDDDDPCYDYFLIGSNTQGFNGIPFNEDHVECNYYFESDTINPFAYPPLERERYIPTEQPELTPLEITVQPQSSTINLGDTITLSVTAQGDDLSYQWYYKKKGATSWSVWNGRTNAAESVTPNATWDGIQLYCKVSDIYGSTVNSNAATITVKQTLKITVQPQSRTINLGDTIKISLTAQGNGLTYQWYYKKKGATSWSIWNNRTKATESVTPNATWDGIQLYCKVKDSAGNTANSNAATITVKQELKITVQPQSKTINLGDTMKISLTAQGNRLTYQWYYKKKGAASWSVWKNRTHASESVTPNATWDGIQLYCKVKDSAGNTVNSSTATITVKQALKITVQPQSKTINLGDTMKISLTAQGNGLTYQWYYKKKGATSWSLWKNHTHASESVTPNATWNGIQLYCKVKDSSGNTVNSNIAVVTING